MDPSRRSHRIAALPNVSYNEEQNASYMSSITYSEVAPVGCVIELKNPKGAQKVYPFLWITKCSKNNITYCGPIYELLQCFAFEAKHIDHHHLLHSGELKSPPGLRSGYVCIYDFKLRTLTVKEFEVLLLRNLLKERDNKIEKLTFTLDFSSNSVYSKLLKRFNGTLNENTYKHDKPAHKHETLQLPLFLKRIKIPVELQTLKSWKLKGRKPRRHFFFEFETDKEEKQWFGESLVRKKQVGNKKSKKIITYKAYQTSISYNEYTMQCSIDSKIKRRIGKGRWT
eukprot:144767_1